MDKNDALQILYEEIDFLYTRGILTDKGLGRTEDIFKEVKRVVKASNIPSHFDNLARSMHRERSESG